MKCNYCRLQDFNARARRQHKKVAIRPTSYGNDVGNHYFGSLGGIDVIFNGKKVAWFMELTDHCCCNKRAIRKYNKFRRELAIS
jgi:hypothetical protein